MSSRKKASFTTNDSNVADTTALAVSTEDDDNNNTEQQAQPNNKARAKHRRLHSFTKRNTLPLKDGSEVASPASSPPRKKMTLRHTNTRTTASKMRMSTRRASTPVKFTVRPMRMSDLAPVYHLGNSVFTASEYPNLYRTWDDYSVIECFTSSAEWCFVAQDDDSHDIIGFLLGEIMSKPNVETRAYIQWVGVAAPYRRHGIATQMLHSFTTQAQKGDNDNPIARLLADTQSDNEPAIAMLKKAGLCHTADHVYMTRQITKECLAKNEASSSTSHVDADGWFDFTYTAKKERITIRNMKIEDLHPVYLIGEQVFTKNHANLYNFWDEHLVLHSFLADPDLCAVATVKKDDAQVVVGFCFGTTIEKPRSSWKYGYLVWLGCATAYQGLGLASQLYNVMLELFIQEKCRIVMIDTQRNNEGALNFFRHKGFGQEEEHVYLSNAAM